MDHCRATSCRSKRISSHSSQICSTTRTSTIVMRTVGKARTATCAARVLLFRRGHLGTGCPPVFGEGSFLSGVSSEGHSIREPPRARFCLILSRNCRGVGVPRSGPMPAAHAYATWACQRRCPGLAPCLLCATRTHRDLVDSPPPRESLLGPASRLLTLMQTAPTCEGCEGAPRPSGAAPAFFSSHPSST